MSSLEKSIVPTYDRLNNNSKCMCNIFSTMWRLCIKSGRHVNKLIISMVSHVIRAHILRGAKYIFVPWGHPCYQSKIE